MLQLNRDNKRSHFVLQVRGGGALRELENRYSDISGASACGPS